MTKKISILSFNLSFTLLLLLLISTVSAQEGYEWIYTSQSADIEINLGTSFIASKDVKEVQAKLSLFPKDSYSSEVTLQETSPPAEFTGEDVIFNWKENELKGEKEFYVKSKVRTTNNFPKITKKVNYPIKSSEFKEYLHSTESVDSSDPKIVELAEKLTQGEDDALVVVSKLASWVEENIEYSLDTVTAEASQSSSWVLANKRGVCDELTNLFIALARASGIPARFVSGTSFTNSPLFPEGWSLHGWAEVYLPEYGWIPVDVTYKQIGRLDIGHVAMKFAKDANDASIKYQWKGGNIDSKKIDVDVSLIESNGKQERIVSLNAKPLRVQAGFGSYNLIEVELENLQDYYVSENINLFVSESLELLDKSHKIILLKPKEKKKVSWLVRIKRDLDESLKYTSFAVAKSSNEESQTSIVSVKNDKIYSRSDVEQYRDIKSSNDKKESIVELICNPGVNEASIGDSVDVTCNIKNKVSKKIVNIELCIDNDCQTLNLEAGEQKKIEKSVSIDNEGIQNIIIRARNYEINDIEVLTIDVEKKADIEIGIETPNEMNYDDEASFTFRVSKREGDPQNVTLKIFLNERRIKTVDLGDDAGISLNIDGSLLSVDENTVSYELSYFDNSGIEYKKEGKTQVLLVDVSSWQRLKIFFRDLLS